ncbi:hypothetical protein [Brevundimonas albigilva]|uniref:DUF1176 domain-containing protein n=1 Tax=Brevundimonas albigilva TaxID=1312364 RepID=A0ABY4STF9_9CAUL|nr:hypothetical protein [Brevundimonas albigilva]URI15955.1 hypothetical protein M8231_02905 [Brevundimonas albigilva]
MGISKSASLLTIGVFVALASPAAAQSNFREALAVRSPEAQRQMIEQVINIQTGGERSLIQGLWGYALGDSAILYCGFRSDAAYRTTGFTVVMNGVDRDTVVFNMGEVAMREAGCTRPDYRTISGSLLPNNPLGGIWLDPAPERTARSTFKPLIFPIEHANEPDCMAGRALAYEAVMLGDTSAVSGFTPEQMNDTTKLFGLCFQVSGQEFTQARLGQIVAEAEARMAPARLSEPQTTTAGTVGSSS